MRGLAFFFFVNLFLIGCGNTTGQPTKLTLNSLDFECTSDKAAQCVASSVARQMRLGLILGTTQDCEDIIDQLGQGDFFSVFDASSVVGTQLSGTTIFGRHTDFVNSSNEAITEIDDGDYKACGYIDVNQNGLMDSGEPFLDTTYDIRLDLERNLTDWKDAP